MYHLTGSLPLSFYIHICISGGPGWPEDLTEEVDLLPEGQADLLQARQQPRLQCAEGHLCPQISRPEGACVLRGLHPAAVSAGVGGGFLHILTLQAVTWPPLYQEQYWAVSRVRLQPVHS